MGEYEDKLAAGGAHRQPEIWVVYSTPEKSDDPRVPRKQTSFASNNREVVYSALPSRYSTKVISRAEFNACGESSSASTSYTGVPMRRVEGDGRHRDVVDDQVGPAERLDPDGAGQVPQHELAEEHRRLSCGGALVSTASPNPSQARGW